MLAVTQFCFHFRERLALELGEAAIQDLRRDIFLHLLRMPMSFYNRMKIGRIISRYTSDAEAVRVGVQDVFFISAVQGGQMIRFRAFDALVRLGAVPGGAGYGARLGGAELLLSARVERCQPGSAGELEPRDLRHC